MSYLFFICDIFINKSNNLCFFAGERYSHIPTIPDECAQHMSNNDDPGQFVALNTEDSEFFTLSYECVLFG